MTKKIKTSPGRPRSFDREEALATAQRLFHMRGYEDVGVAELGNAIGIKPASLYAAFNNKAGLFGSALERYAQTDGQFMADAFAGADTARDGLEKMFLAAASTYTRDPDCRGCMVMDGTSRAENDASRLCAVMAEATRANVAAFLAEEYPETADHVARLTMIALAGLSAAARSGASPDDLQAYARLSARSLCDALAP